MNASQRSVFHFHADANPIGGRITAPIDQFLPPHGSASLAQAGGHAAGRIGPHRIDGILSFENAHSEIFGHKQGPNGPWTTTVSSVVEGLNILDIVRADALVTKIKLTHPHAGRYAAVSFAGTHFLNFTIAGERVCPVFNLEAFARSEKQVTAHPGWWEEDPDHLEAAMAHNERLVKLAQENPAELSWLEKSYGWMTPQPKEKREDAKQRVKRGSIVSSLVKEIADASGKSKLGHGHILNVPELGHLFLGEVSVSRGVFRVTLLRAELGCQADGAMSAASGAAGGGAGGGPVDMPTVDG